MMNFIEIITKRRSYRGAFLDNPIAQSDVEQLIEAARWAPSPFNIQPWELILVTSQEKKEALAELTAQCIIAQFKDPRFLADSSEWMRLTVEEWKQHGDGVFIDGHVTLPDFITDKRKLRPLLNNAKHLSIFGHLGAGKLPAKEFAEWIRQSPLLILVLMDKSRRSPGTNGHIWKLLGMGAMIQNIHLVATLLNIGLQYVNASLETKNDRQKVREIFAIPSHYEPMNLLRLGYIKSPPRDSVRRAASQLVHYDSF